LAAIALMQGHQASRLREHAISQVEEHLKAALIDIETEATALTLLGIVKHDYYIINGMFAGEPSLKEIRETLQKIGLKSIDHRLLSYVKATSTVLEILNLSNAI
jgi:hypothetical protein